MGGDALPDDVRQVFLASFDASLATIAAAQRNNDALRVLAELHSLRGTLGVFRQCALAVRCAALEARIRSEGLVGLAGVDVASHLQEMPERGLTHA
ncbi:hypothetical protein FVF58_29045 [Paraburkholderia panacisoli]|uniref:HPt domain-containing protein n=1 Tax=Paraburkholderia panacisoli TaxID=2603818 RepID=A0A5B0GQW7_9BURK|nr:Hpt domain-containing protein [Paraburkholderia panacisoli]KAA1005277.1 hypothetical protein FVF58_29045 [Paraburkholderia panacisoli]